MLRCEYYSTIREADPGWIVYKGFNIMGVQSKKELKRLFDALPPTINSLTTFSEVPPPICFTETGDIYTWINKHQRNEIILNHLQELNIKLFEG